MKPVALIFVMTGFLMLGRSKGNACSERARLLSALCTFLRTAREGILYRSLPPDEIVLTALRRKDLSKTPFLVSLSGEPITPNGFAAAFRKSLEPLPLRDTERDVLAAWGETLGKSDRESQIFACDEALCRLNELTRQAEEEAQKQSRMWTSLGAVGGALAVILLI